MLVFNISILAYSFIVRFSSVLTKKGRRRETVGVNTFIVVVLFHHFTRFCLLVCVCVCVPACVCILLLLL